jgi:hypothetical protein
MRYGVVSHAEREKYELQFRERMDYQDVKIGETQNIDVPLLPGETEMDYERDTIAPSKKFEQSTLSGDQVLSKKSPYFIRREHEKLIKRFRCILDGWFRGDTDEAVATRSIQGENFDAEYDVGKPLEVEEKSFRPAIKSARMRLQLEKSLEGRFRVISNLLRGTSLLTRADYVRYLFFHESVITGLNTLSCVYTALFKYQQLVLATNLEEYGKALTATTADAAATKAKLVSHFKPLYAKGQSADNSSYLLDLLIGGRYVVNGYNAGASPVSVVDSQIILADLLEAIYGLSNDAQGLVGVRVEDNRIHLNFSPLKEHVEKMFASIRGLLIYCVLMSNRVSLRNILLNRILEVCTGYRSS